MYNISESQSSNKLESVSLTMIFSNMLQPGNRKKTNKIKSVRETDIAIHVRPTLQIKLN